MRYYVFSVQYNAEAGSENRTVPKAFDTYNEAVAQFHSTLASDMKNPKLGWSICMVINSDCAVLMEEKYIADTVEEVAE